MAAPIYNVSPQMGSDLIIVVFAVVVIGGMGSIMGAIVTGFALGIVEGLTKVFYPGSLEHRDLRHHGDRAADAAGRPVWTERMMERVLRPAGADEPTAAATAASASRFALMIVLFAVAPFFVYPVFLMKALCFALFACAFNLLIGYVGLASFGHALFFGWASYFDALTRPKPGAGRRSSRLSCGTAVAAALGFVAGGLAIRRQGIYFAMITLALAQMMYFFALQAKFTGGEDGIQGVPRGRLFGLFDLSHEMTMYVFVLVVFLAGLHSHLPDHQLAVRRSAQGDPRERAARHLARLQDRALQARSPSCCRRRLAGLAGSMNALVFQLASLTDVHWTMSGDVLLMTLLGGLGTIFGPVVGAFIVVAMQNYLAPFGQWVLVIQGVIFVVCVLLFRRGIVGELARLARVQL